jgi:hypothetical protein
MEAVYEYETGLPTSTFRAGGQIMPFDNIRGGEIRGEQENDKAASSSGKRDDRVNDPNVRRDQ